MIKNKQYTHRIMNCDKFGWAVYMPTDGVKPFGGTIDTGRYCIETTDYFALNGNGWYCDSVVERALTYKLITPGNIKYQMKASVALQPDHFNQFVLDVYDKFEPCGQQAINGFIGLLGKSTCKSDKHYFESNYDVVANELINNENSVEIKGVYPQENNQTEYLNLLNVSNDEFNNVICETHNNTTEPLLYHLSMKVKIPMYGNTLPIHRKIYDVARMDMYELHLQIKELNPNCELAGMQTDCLVYNNITVEPPTSNTWGDVKKV